MWLQSQRATCRGYRRIRDPQFVTYETGHVEHQMNIAFFPAVPRREVS